MNLGLEGFENLMFPDLDLGPAHFWLNMFEVQVFWRGSKFSFGGETWVRVSSKFNISSSKGFEVHYIWVRSNTNSCLKFDINWSTRFNI